MKHWCVYIMANKPNGVIYIGVTDNIDERVKEHKNKIYPKSFTAKYNCENLVYFEGLENGKEASIREKQFKKWKREWKVKLIVEMNPNWSDLSVNWNLDNKEFRVNK
ncbi:GIY-YIG nuclease family protein [Flavivirga spongiicola]|uniref:GIY-YIG nuclease family protein n=1 Tax=Flavivirga spongiicola TaxID=421621 RepID=A0ABU7XXP8_9FLAO|nr:GIY-YIG nuclease family protein [Flavivirga sp. MEBiC05379]MDO5979726.1 GIY-YIG nuclease family protein [Flavivirga sp. MEBiC05379]